jgi:hypothetical protein
VSFAAFVALRDGFQHFYIFSILLNHSYARRCKMKDAKDAKADSLTDSLNLD